MITFEGSKEELSEHYEHRLHSLNQVQYFLVVYYVREVFKNILSELLL